MNINNTEDSVGICQTQRSYWGANSHVDTCSDALHESSAHGVSPKNSKITELQITGVIKTKLNFWLNLRYIIIGQVFQTWNFNITHSWKYEEAKSNPI